MMSFTGRLRVDEVDDKNVSVLTGLGCLSAK